MLVAKKIADIKAQMCNVRQEGKTIAFVPTMGALHVGHLSLIQKAQELGHHVVVSIFVNKTQFNDIADYENYPTQYQQDLEQLESMGVEHVFMPTDQEIFADGCAFKIIPTDYVDVLCGASRPGHFDGVALIVTKLFNIIQPHVAIFGEKDFQQLLIIRKLVQDLNLDVEIIAAPIKREASGLAMSSRNQRLSKDEQQQAAMISQILQHTRDAIRQNPDQINAILAKKSQQLIDAGFTKIDYFEVRKQDDLKLVTSFDKAQSTRIFIAVYLGKIRLIDNWVL